MIEIKKIVYSSCYIDTSIHWSIRHNWILLYHRYIISIIMVIIMVIIGDIWFYGVFMANINIQKQFIRILWNDCDFLNSPIQYSVYHPQRKVVKCVFKASASFVVEFGMCELTGLTPRMPHPEKICSTLHHVVFNIFDFGFGTYST